MHQLYRFWVGALGAAALLAASRPALAQCPAAAACTPGAASGATATLAAFKMGIYNVTLGSINNTTGGYADGYKDYSCTVGTSLTVSTATAITVKNGTVANENVRVWIDYNNDGTFASNELAFTSDGKMTHTGTITPPATAVLNTKLRLRVASDYANNTTAITACSTPVYSQDEDYAVTLVANANPPTAAFAPGATTTCTGCVQFTDQSTGSPTSWSWDFGDGSTSTQQSPNHCYATAGTFAVKLTATNAAGSSTTAATSIIYNPSVPVAASCAGQAASGNCCGYGITLVKLGSISNASADGSVGYQDFTCTQRTSLMASSAYTLSLTTGSTQPYDTRAWIDYNNDGTFASSELVLQALNTTSPSASFSVPASAVLGQPLRLRIVADGVGSNPQPCTAPQLGQVEDYTVTVQPNTSPPVAAFTSNYVAGVCGSNTYTFTDQSTNAPTAWQWAVSPSTGVSFVGGTSASSQNPQIAFSVAGYYSVSLMATSTYGSNTVTKTNYVLAQVPCLTYCTAAGGYSATVGSATFYITNVAVTAAAGGGTAFSNSSGSSVPAYTFYSAAPVVLQAGSTQTLTVTTSLSIQHRTSVWIDYNRDGTFANTTGNTELVYNGISGLGSVSISLAVPATLAVTRMRVLVANDNNTPNPCATYYGLGEVEDYVVTPQVLAAQQSTALPALTLSPNPTPDGELLLRLSDAAANGRYAVEVTNVLGARLLVQELHLSASQPTALSLSALPAGLYLVRLTNEQGQTALRRVVRQ